MTDRELEGRLRALYRSRVPAEDAAPLALRAELVAITGASSPSTRLRGSRAWTLLAAAALLSAMMVGGALVAGSGLLRSTSVVELSGSPSGSPSGSHAPTSSPTSAPDSSEPAFIGGWPSMSLNNPAGLYTWDPYGVYNWVHKVPYGAGKSASVELRFRWTPRPDEVEALAAALAAYGDRLVPDHPIEMPGLTVQTWVFVGGAPDQSAPPTSGPARTPQIYVMGIDGREVAVEQGAPGQSAPPSSEIAMTTQTWMMEIDGRAVAFDVVTYADTTPSLIAEAEAAIRSVRLGENGYGDPVVVFELTRRWDSG